MFHFTLTFFEGPHTSADVINAFFVYSFCGWVMECLVIRRKKVTGKTAALSICPCASYTASAP